MAKSNTGSSNKLLAALIVLGLALVVAAVVNFIFVARLSSEDAQFLGHLDEQAVLSQTMVKNVDRALSGDQEGFQELAHVRDRFGTTLDGLRDGIPEGMMVESPDEIRSEVLRLVENWSNARENIQTILDSRDSVMVAHDQLDIVRESMPQLLGQLDVLAEQLSDRGASERIVYHVGRQGFYGQRILQSANNLVLGRGGSVSESASRLDADTQYFGRVWAAFFDGDPNLEINPIEEESEAYRVLEETDLIYGRVDDAVQTLVSMDDTLVANHRAAIALGGSSDLLLGDINNIDNIYQRSVESRLIQPEYGYILGGAGIVVFGLLIFIYNLTSDTRRAAALQAEQNERNQEAILRLLDELGSLADGDLTVQVSVTEDITGAIADSINYAIEALRDLVTTINDTAVRVDSTAQQTRATASHLAEASDNQSREIISASEQISDMAKSIEQVSANAERSTRVAQQSVEIAHKGGDAVRRTIEGMNNIRETIQETSKRIKRLGESSQEIGDIVELINDIAEQTNILALNAAIQASMAGEAGRGFAVVADEVQRLAERSGNATRQIEALVKTIQTDTNEAVISMEHSTAGVVSGAQLAENAGEALDEIEKVSNHIATLIQSISNAARQQATAAADVSRTMNVIQEITSQTAEGTTATAQNIGKLADLATELRKSVAGFKLPGMEDEETMVMSPEKAAARFGDTHKLSQEDEIPDVDEAVSAEDGEEAASAGEGESAALEEDAFAFEENPEADSGESPEEGTEDDQDRKFRENV